MHAVCPAARPLAASGCGRPNPESTSIFIRAGASCPRCLCCVLTALVSCICAVDAAGRSHLFFPLTVPALTPPTIPVVDFGIQSGIPYWPSSSDARTGLLRVRAPRVILSFISNDTVARAFFSGSQKQRATRMAFSFVRLTFEPPWPECETVVVD